MLSLLPLLLLYSSSQAAPRLPTTGGLNVTLELGGSDRVFITIANQSAKAVAFCPRADFLVCYHQAPDGRKTAITWDASNANMRPLSPKDLVTLQPGASDRLKRALWIEPRHGIDRSRLWKTKGVVYAVVHAFGPGVFASSHKQAAKKLPLLRQNVQSNEIRVP